MKEDKSGRIDTIDERRTELCQLAPEWAEHARLDESMDACDDGRTGIICGNREGEQPCPVGQG